MILVVSSSGEYTLARLQELAATETARARETELGSISLCYSICTPDSRVLFTLVSSSQALALALYTHTLTRTFHAAALARNNVMRECVYAYA